MHSLISCEVIMRFRLELTRRHPLRQRIFDFLERRRRHERWFKRWILTATCLTVALVLETLPRGRYLMAGLASEARQAARYAIGVPTPREEIADAWQRYRLLGIAESRAKLVEVFAEASPELQRLMRYAGLGPERGLLRWGNYNQTLLLPSTVFEADDAGR